MSTATDSAAPDQPTASSPLRPRSSLSDWFVYITGWIRSLSPPGEEKYDTGWKSLTPLLQAGWTPAGGTSPKYRRIGKTVSLVGQLVHLNASTTPVLAFTLPDGFRPTLGGQMFPQSSNTTVAMHADVGMDGSVTMWAATTTESWRPLSGIRFEVD